MPRYWAISESIRARTRFVKKNHAEMPVVFSSKQFVCRCVVTRSPCGYAPHFRAMQVLTCAGVDSLGRKAHSFLPEVVSRRQRLYGILEGNPKKRAYHGRNQRDEHGTGVAFFLTTAVEVTVESAQPHMPAEAMEGRWSFASEARKLHALRAGPQPGMSQPCLSS